jgi:hypothetical protein
MSLNNSAMNIGVYENKVNLMGYIRKDLIDLLKLINPDIYDYIDTFEIDYTSKENTLINELKYQCIKVLTDVVYLNKFWYNKDIFDMYFSNNPSVNTESITKFEVDKDLLNYDLINYINKTFNVNSNYIDLNKADRLIGVIEKKLDFLNYIKYKNYNSVYNIITIEHDIGKCGPEFIAHIEEDIRDYRFREIKNIMKQYNID